MQTTLNFYLNLPTFTSIPDHIVLRIYNVQLTVELDTNTIIRYQLNLPEYSTSAELPQLVLTIKEVMDKILGLYPHLKFANCL